MPDNEGEERRVEEERQPQTPPHAPGLEQHQGDYPTNNFAELLPVVQALLSQILYHLECATAGNNLLLALFGHNLHEIQGQASTAASSNLQELLNGSRLHGRGDPAGVSTLLADGVAANGLRAANGIMEAIRHIPFPAVVENNESSSPSLRSQHNATQNVPFFYGAAGDPENNSGSGSAGTAEWNLQRNNDHDRDTAALLSAMATIIETSRQPSAPGSNNSSP